MHASRFAHAVVVVVLLCLATPLAAQTDTFTVLGHYQTGACNGFDLQGPYAYHGNGCFLEIVDITEPAAPEPRGRILLPAMVEDVVVIGQLAYVADSYWGLQIVDVADPTAPFLVSALNIGTRSASLAVNGDHVYLVDTYEGMFIIDVSDPSNPGVVQHLDPVPFPQDIAVANDLAYLATWNGIFIYDVTDPAGPIQLSVIPEGAYYGYEGIRVRGDLIHVASGQGGLRIWDVSDPIHPVFLDDLNVGDTAEDVDLHGDVAVVTCQHGRILMVNVAKPNNLVSIGELNPIGTARKVLCRGGLAHVAARGYGLRIINLADPTQPAIIGTCPVGGHGVGLDVHDGMAFVAESNGGLRILDVTDSTDPTPVGYCRVDDYFSDLDCQGDLAFASGARGVWLFDVSDHTDPQLISFFDADGRVDDVAVHGDLVCFVIYGKGLGVLNVADPYHPYPQGLLQVPGADQVVVDDHYAYYPVTDFDQENGGLYVIDYTFHGVLPIVGRFETWKATKVARHGDRVHFYGRGEDRIVGLVTLDVSDPAEPREVGFLDMDWPATSLAATSEFVYLYTMFGDELLAIDVSDSSEPVVTGTFERPGWWASCIQATDDLIYINGVWVLRHDRVTGIVGESALPEIFLEQNYPNPFNPVTSIRFSLPEVAAVRLGIYGVDGRLVATLVDEGRQVGVHVVTWRGVDERGMGVASGTYFCRLEVGDSCEVRKMTLMQ